MAGPGPSAREARPDDGQQTGKELNRDKNSLGRRPAWRDGHPRYCTSGHTTEGDGFISQIANGKSSHVRSVIIDSVVVGTHVVSNVEMGVGPERLLGMNVLSHICAGKFTVDTQNNQLVFG